MGKNLLVPRPLKVLFPASIMAFSAGLLADGAVPNVAAGAACIGTGALLKIILVSGLLGAVGQGARAVVGIKKEYDAQSTAKIPDPNWFKYNELLMSLIIGAIAGIVAGLVLFGGNVDCLSNQMILSLLAAGYAGTDFIEGIMKTALPVLTGGANNAPVTPQVLNVQASNGNLPAPNTPGPAVFAVSAKPGKP